MLSTTRGLDVSIWALDLTDSETILKPEFERNWPSPPRKSMGSLRSRTHPAVDRKKIRILVALSAQRLKPLLTERRECVHLAVTGAPDLPNLKRRCWQRSAATWCY